jgi:GTP pyrophosphokinase
LGISDFIAQPKPNGYKSIHTKVFDHKGNILEIQIRSQEMHLQAELGAAAHFAYATAKNSGVEDEKLENGVGFVVSKKMEWVKELADWKNQIVSVHERQKDLKLDTLSKHIYVFSPKGDVYDLPENATPIDYAFSVHTNLGFYISSVKVNGKIAQVNYPLKSGDVVEILKSRVKKLPNKNWLRFVKSNRAKSKLRQALQQ